MIDNITKQRLDKVLNSGGGTTAMLILDPKNSARAKAPPVPPLLSRCCQVCQTTHFHSPPPEFSRINTLSGGLSNS